MRILEEEKVPSHNVKHFITEEDRKRIALLETFFRFHVNPPCAFDMVINTEKIVPDGAVKSIVEVVKHLERKTSYREPTTRTIEVEPALHDLIVDVLERKPD
jgi:cytidylate kinase